VTHVEPSTQRVWWAFVLAGEGLEMSVDAEDAAVVVAGRRFAA